MRLIKNIFITISVVILISQSVFCGSNSTYKFLRNDVSARAAALGGSFLTTTNDPNTIFYNPSALASINQRQVSIGYFNHLLDINSGHLSYSDRVEGFGFIGAGIIYTHYGDFEMRNELGYKEGNFSAGDFAVSAAYADQLIENVTYGASIKFIYSTIASYNSYGVATDFGVTYTAIPDRFHVAASLLNLGTQLKPYINTKEKLPLDLKIGASLKPEHLPLRINISFNKLLDYQNNFSSRFRSFTFGGEFTLTQNVQFRFGYNNENRKDLKIDKSAGLAGFSIGGGFLYEVYKIDYAFNSMGKIGGLHRITVGILL
ncbi:MAG: type IX secretion system protein PorQ [Bacteroidetes bacterium]|nr:type IX secretion system protein PorQ [Bacteroidota bacterium]MBU1423874.1 type IX secretion system protein PorQ [Bacteroidota bacterium]MBU2635674.1 type IX secretion system protein PorQ [Bacteroidota bacterium]